jgi:hypothetical protein
VTAAVFVAGWFVGAASVALLLGGIVRLADYMEGLAVTTQPAGVRDPETGLLYDERGVIRGLDVSA